MIQPKVAISIVLIAALGLVESASLPQDKVVSGSLGSDQPTQQFSNPLAESHVEYAAVTDQQVRPEDEASRVATSPTRTLTKLKRDSRAKLTALELDSQDTFLHPHPDAYPDALKDAGYDHDSGKNSYGKQASDWSLYDHGNDGLYDKYGDKGWNDQGHKSHSAYGKHDSYGNSYSSQNGGHGSGYYSRDRGYGYEKHYAYDKEVASKQHADNHNNYGNHYGLHDYYGNAASAGHHNQGHDRFGQLSRYGNHGYGKRIGDLSLHHNYGHDHDKGHYYAQHIPHYPTYSYGHSSGYSSHPPTYKSTYSDYSPYVGYPSSYPSYY